MIRGSLRKAVATAAAVVSLTLGGTVAGQSFSDGYKFLEAVEKKDVDEVDSLLGKPGSTVINSRDLSTGRTGLHIAAERRDAVWLAYLANRGANPNIADNRGTTPLMRASQIGFIEGVEALIKAGARVDIANATGETPLISAVLRRDMQMMRVLLRAGASPTRADNSGRSALDYARLEGSGSTMLAEMERSSAGTQASRATGEVYGPR